MFLVDDVLIFCKAQGQEAEELWILLEIYGKTSWQMINTNKSSVFFSKNVGKDHKNMMLQKLNHMRIVTQSKYLGLPMVIGRSKLQVFQYIKDILCGKLNDWKGKLLSKKRKEGINVEVYGYGTSILCHVSM